MATTNVFCLASPPLARICLSRGFTTIWPPPQPVCEHGSGEVIRALSLQVPDSAR